MHALPILLQLLMLCQFAPSVWMVMQQIHANLVRDQPRRMTLREMYYRLVSSEVAGFPFRCVHINSFVVKATMHAAFQRQSGAAQ